MLLKAQALQDAGSYAELEHHARELIRTADHAGDQRAIARAFTFLGVALMRQGNAREAEQALREAVIRFEDFGDNVEAARAKMNLGALALDVNLDVEAARRYYAQALPVVETSGNPKLLGIALANLAEIGRVDGEYVEALKLAKRALPLFHDAGEPWRYALMLVTVAHLHALLRQFAEATIAMARAYQSIERSGNPSSLALYFEVYAIIVAEYGDADDAALLLGFVDGVRKRHGVVAQSGMLPWVRPAIERLERVLGPRFAIAKARGAAMEAPVMHALVAEFGKKIAVAGL